MFHLTFLEVRLPLASISIDSLTHSFLSGLVYPIHGGLTSTTAPFWPFFQYSRDLTKQVPARIPWQPLHLARPMVSAGGGERIRYKAKS